MSLKDKLTKPEPYHSEFHYSDLELQLPAKQLCWEFNQCAPTEHKKKNDLLKRLFGTFHKMAFIEQSFRCDFGFNIHFHGMAIVNYNCTILDTSPVNIGAGVMLAPGVCISCAGHAIHPTERIEGITTSAPITLEDGVWVGANSTIGAGVTIGAGSIIGAGSVVTRDIPSGVVAVGNPCKVMRPITEEDRIHYQG